MTLTIRPETIHDVPATAEIHLLAFEQRLDEALITAQLRQLPQFDPTLSLVAEWDGQVVGHALFMPYAVRLMGQTVRAVCLAPIGILPQFQRRGIGGALIEQGHRAARDKGFAFSFLLGHDTYYPRFGYVMGAFSGRSTLTVMAESNRPSHFETRKPAATDIAALQALWLTEEGAVDFAVQPSASLVEFVSPDPRVRCEVYLEDESIVGYTRIRATAPTEPLVFWAAHPQAARLMLAQIATPNGELTLPLHLRSASAAALSGTPELHAWRAAMVCPLLDSPFDEYLAQVQAQARPIGRVAWPALFEIA